MTKAELERWALREAYRRIPNVPIGDQRSAVEARQAFADGVMAVCAMPGMAEVVGQAVRLEEERAQLVKMCAGDEDLYARAVLKAEELARRSASTSAQAVATVRRQIAEGKLP